MLSDGVLILKRTYRPDIDGLRALAVVAVIIFHFNKSLMPSGYLGVDIFFVISGFVITSSLAASPSNTVTELLLSFYERRIKRLLPSLIACVVITSVLICLLNPNPQISLKTGIAALFGFSNLYLYQQSFDYYAPSAAANVFTQTWSLGVEEQFYIFFPLLVWITGFGRTNTGSRHLCRIISAVSLVSVVGFIYLNHIDPMAAHFLMPTRFWELGLGCLLFLFLNKNKRSEPFMASKVEPLILVGALVLVLFFPLHLSVYATILSVLLTVLILASVRPGTRAYAVFASPVFVYIGRISYSLYLWHWSVLSVSRWSVGIHLWTAPFQIGIMLLLAIASYRYLENPLRHAEWSNLKWKSISFGMSACIISALFGLFLQSEHGLFIHSTNNPNSNHRAALPSPTSPILAAHEPVIAGNDNSIKVEKTESGVKELIIPPSFFPIKGSGLPYDPNCVVDGSGRKLKPETFNLCTVMPKRPNAQMIWAVGDSHAGHLQGLLYGVHDQIGLGVHLIETPGAPFPFIKGRVSEGRNIIFNEIKRRARKGDILLVARSFILTDSKSVNSDVPDWMSDLAKLAKTLSAKGINIVVTGPPPFFEFVDISTCTSSVFTQNPCDVERASISESIETINRYLAEVARQKNNVYVFDEFDLICSKSNIRCSPIRDGVMLYRDRDHLNTFGSASLTKDFISFLLDKKLLID
jgi:peptidoglycan/LPS O-acetylase OafA/YrhL